MKRLSLVRIVRVVASAMGGGRRGGGGGRSVSMVSNVCTVNHVGHARLHRYAGFHRKRTIYRKRICYAEK